MLIIISSVELDALSVYEIVAAKEDVSGIGACQDIETILDRSINRSFVFIDKDTSVINARGDYLGQIATLVVGIFSSEDT